MPRRMESRRERLEISSNNEEEEVLPGGLLLEFEEKAATTVFVVDNWKLKQINISADNDTDGCIW
eukprot:10107638-Ditylum_brightwellii.AAC.1